MLRRLHPSNKVAIYTEFSNKYPNEEYPDLVLVFLNSKFNRVIYEIQKEITPEWLKQAKERYIEDDLIIIPLNELSTDLIELKKELEKYLV